MKPDEVQAHLRALAGHLGGDVDNQNEFGQIGKYRIGKGAILGLGGQSIAIRAWDPDLERDVVLKVYHAANTEELREQVLKEGRALAKIDSPYVVRCHNVETFAGNPCLVLEHVSGVNLASQVRLKTYSHQQAAELIAKISEGLEAVHARGIVHRDLKPANIVITSDGTPKIVDFGLSALGSGSTQGSAGTAVYTPPERARGESGGDVRGDVFGLGTILFEMLTGQAPFAAPTAAEATAKASAGELSVPIPIPDDAVSKICLRCLSAAPVERYESAKQVGDAAKATLQSSGLTLKLVAAAAILLIPLLAFGMSKLGSADVPEQEPVPIAKPITYFVDSRAMPSGDGKTTERAFQSIAEAMSVARADDTIRIRGYRDGFHPLHYSSRSVLIRHKGITLTNWGPEFNTAAAPESESQRLPQINGTYPIGEENDKRRKEVEAGDPMVRIAADNVTVSNLMVCGSRGAGIAIQGLEDNECSSVTVQNCYVHRCRGPGIIASNAAALTIEDALLRYCAEYEGKAHIEVTGSKDLQILRCEILHPFPTPGSETLAGGIYLNGCESGDLDGNTIKQLPGQKAIYISGAVSHLWVSRSFIYGCGRGIILDPENNPTSEVDVFSNLVVRCDGPALFVGAGDRLSQLSVNYNTFFECQGGGALFSGSRIRRGICTNNLLFDNSGPDLRLSDTTGLRIFNNVYRHGMIELSEAYEGLEQNFQLLAEDGTFPPQLEIQQSGKADALEPASYAPCLKSAGIDNGNQTRLPLMTKDLTSTLRGDQPDIGAVERRRD
jgi:serine/threonine-protein kinase